MSKRFFFSFLRAALPAFVVLAFFAVNHFALAADSSTVTLTNPLNEEITDPRAIIGLVINAMLSIIGSIALLMFVYGGVMWLTSFGKPEKVDKGKEILIWAVLGLGIIASAYVITQAVINGLTTSSVSST